MVCRAAALLILCGWACGCWAQLQPRGLQVDNGIENAPKVSGATVEDVLNLTEALQPFAAGDSLQAISVTDRFLVIPPQPSSTSPPSLSASQPSNNPLVHDAPVLVFRATTAPEKQELFIVGLADKPQLKRLELPASITPADSDKDLDFVTMPGDAKTGALLDGRYYTVAEYTDKSLVLFGVELDSRGGALATPMGVIGTADTASHELAVFDGKLWVYGERASSTGVFIISPPPLPRRLTPWLMDTDTSAVGTLQLRDGSSLPRSPAWRPLTFINGQFYFVAGRGDMFIAEKMRNGIDGRDGREIEMTEGITNANAHLLRQREGGRDTYQAVRMSASARGLLDQEAGVRVTANRTNGAFAVWTGRLCFAGAAGDGTAGILCYNPRDDDVRLMPDQKRRNQVGVAMPSKPLAFTVVHDAIARQPVIYFSAVEKDSPHSGRKLFYFDGEAIHPVAVPPSSMTSAATQPLTPVHPQTAATPADTPAATNLRGGDTSVALKAPAPTSGEDQPGRVLFGGQHPKLGTTIYEMEIWGKGREERVIKPIDVSGSEPRGYGSLGTSALYVAVERDGHLVLVKVTPTEG